MEPGRYVIPLVPQPMSMVRSVVPAGSRLRNVSQPLRRGTFRWKPWVPPSLYQEEAHGGVCTEKKAT